VLDWPGKVSVGKKKKGRIPMKKQIVKSAGEKEGTKMYTMNAQTDLFIPSTVNKPGARQTLKNKKHEFET